MRLLVLSDLHLEFAPFEAASVDIDAVVLAGDVDHGMNGLEWIHSYFKGVPVIYVLGNHEFYGQTIPVLTDELIARAAGTHVHVLENARVDVGDVSFVGATLWTDMALNGNPILGEMDAERGMNDYKHIRTSPDSAELRARHVRRFHALSKTWLNRQFDELQGRRFVVVTHHAPSPKSIPRRYQDDRMTLAYASRLDSMVAQSGAALWIHGHIHSASDYTLGGTRLVANPRGYPGEDDVGFRPDLVIDV